MGTSLAVILTNLWLKGYELALMKEVPKLTALNEDNKKVCPRCQKKVTNQTKGVECEACLNWCGSISESEYAEIAKTIWYCITCKKQEEADRTENVVKVSLRFVDDIVRTVKGDPGVVFEAANKLHPNLQLTIEELDCAILEDWHRVTFRHDTRIEIEALAIKNCCERGSEYSGILIFKKSICDVTFLRNINGNFEPKSDEKQNNS